MKAFWDERGQGLGEYALILLLVAIVIVAILTIFGVQLGGTYSRIVDCVPPTATCS